MGLGDLLGSISPAFGMASGNGLFGNMNGMGQSGLFGLLGLLLSHGNKGAAPPASPAASPASPTASPAMLPGTTLPVPQPLTTMGGPSLSQTAMPGMASPNPLSTIGAALQSSNSGNGDMSAGLSASQAMPPMLMPQNHSGLQAMLQSLGIF